MSETTGFMPFSDREECEKNSFKPVRRAEPAISTDYGAL
jgi:hypothetical protein